MSVIWSSNLSPVPHDENWALSATATNDQRGDPIWTPSHKRQDKTVNGWRKWKGITYGKGYCVAFISPAEGNDPAPATPGCKDPVCRAVAIPAARDGIDGSRAQSVYPRPHSQNTVQLLRLVLLHGGLDTPLRKEFPGLLSTPVMEAVPETPRELLKIAKCPRAMQISYLLRPSAG